MDVIGELEIMFKETVMLELKVLVQPLIVGTDGIQIIRSLEREPDSLPSDCEAHFCGR
jgi:hypothetical protein